ncbi:DUF6479 family protein [Streptomyces phyllanthi]|uniref:Secreted protein n=1 Tax=Streptomyces phyllanthi TaxID=1803180 RepID=A0A5N8WHJ1_9ACTN|nr:DUF6479 family protein [Streptomyces phyllanthi]MPY46930.1 hypothetical protein [Streptomyces phyllanthi]
MSTEWVHFAAERSALVGLWAILMGVLVVGMLGGAFWLGNRIRNREPRRPRPEEQPHLPDGGPVREEQVNLVPDEITQSRLRLTPYQVHGNMGSRPSPAKRRPRWSRGSSGGFGSGGLGAH